MSYWITRFVNLTAGRHGGRCRPGRDAADRLPRRAVWLWTIRWRKLPHNKWILPCAWRTICCSAARQRSSGCPHTVVQLLAEQVLLDRRRSGPHASSLVLAVPRSRSQDTRPGAVAVDIGQSPSRCRVVPCVPIGRGTSRDRRPRTVARRRREVERFPFSSTGRRRDRVHPERAGRIPSLQGTAG